MHLKDLPKHYDPKLVEDRWYDFWMRGGFFHADPKSNKET